MNGALFSACHVMYMDHLAVTTQVFEQTLTDYLGLVGARLLKGPAVNPEQKVRYAFVQLRDGMTIEVLAPEADSPIARHAQQRGGPYHFCYAVADLGFSLAAAQRFGAKLIAEPTADVAFDGRRVVSLFHPAHGVFELVEAYPRAEGALCSAASERPASQRSAVAASGQREAVDDDIEKRLQLVFRHVFPTFAQRDLPLAAMNNASEWDSLAQIQLVMELEAAFSCNIPPGQIEMLISYQAILLYLRREAT